jgi:1,2-diacylglycerol 3-alpha-glucosyltransferase
VRVGVVSKWFNRGQPVVGRQVRSALDELGHETFVLARPKKERGPRPGALDRDDVWDQPAITEAAGYEIGGDEYERWVEENGIEAILCDQNYQFEEIAALRERGVRTIGRFVWEHFAADHVDDALEAYDVVYSFTRAEQARYGELGIESPYIPWGCHPELLAIARGAQTPAKEEGTVVFVFPAGFAGHRKPLAPVLDAFTRTRDPRLRLLIKAQVDREELEAAEAAPADDERVAFLVADQPTQEHLRAFAACDVCLAPSRWEGLGLPLYEAIAFGMPAITNDAPPMNEAIHDDVNGLLVESRPDGEARSGIPAVTPDLDALAAAIERLADDEERARLAAGARQIRDTERRWELTVQGIGGLLESVFR